MPYVLAGAPATFQSVVEDMVQVLDTNDILAYVDDVICFHATFDKHLDGVRKLLEMVKRVGLKLSAKKCQFAKRSVNFLGHIIDHTGVRPVPEKLEIIRNCKIPESEDELRQFLGVCTFWRRFVKDFAHIAVPLHNLLNKQEFLRTNECLIAFEFLKEHFFSDFEASTAGWSIFCHMKTTLWVISWNKSTSLVTSSQWLLEEGNYINQN